jgi:hypothetical protein
VRCRSQPSRRSRSGRPRRAPACPPGGASRRSISSAPAPETHGLPIPRATSAACEALPPSEVRIPLAAWKPATSSASVNGLTKITSQPSPAAATASSAVNTIAQLAAPGDAARPSANTSNWAWRANGGCSSASSLPASIVAIASPLSSKPSSTAPNSNRTAACAGRFASLVWSMNRRLSSTAMGFSRARPCQCRRRYSLRSQSVTWSANRLSS